MRIYRTNRRPARPSEEGYILVGVVFMLALLMIAMMVAAPKIAKSIQRDREVETMHRGKQYARAVKLYYKKFGRYPPNLDALVKTNEIRFLRKKYLDPMTGKDDWQPIQVGQNKTQSMGFFGQPIAGTTLGGIGPSGGNGLNGIGGSTTGGIGVNGQGSSDVLGATGTTDNGTSNGSTDQSGNANGSSTDGSGQAGGTGGATGPGNGTGFGQGQTFGGIGIMGFKPASPKQSILIYKKKNHYNEWEFFYDPIADQLTQQGGNQSPVIPLQPGAPGFNQNPGAGATPTPTPAPAPTGSQQ